MRKLFLAFIAIIILFGLYAANFYNFLLFHSIAEGFSIVIACGIFMVAWNTRHYNPGNYLVFIGIAYLFIGILDFSHTLSYEGMNIFVRFDANAPTQLWIATRYVESLTLLLAPFLSKRRIRIDVCFAAYGIITAAILLTVFYWQVFPDCFLADAGGLTPFKIISEYIICLLLLASGVLFVYERNHFDPRFLRLVLMSLATTIAAELLFTTYASVYGFSNLLGHYLKIVSFYLMYKAVIETGLRKPYDLVFRNLHQQREWLRVTLVSIGDAVIATDTKGNITFLNKVAEDLTGWRMDEAVEKPVNEVFRIVNEHSREIVENPVYKVLAIGEIVGLANHTLLIRKNVEELPVDDSAAPIRANDGSLLGAVLVFRDISERKRAEDVLRKWNETLEQTVIERTELAEARSKQLQALTMELIEAEEQERKRIAEILHDDLQQLLAGAKLQVQVADDRLPEDSPAKSILGTVSDLLLKSINQSRRLSHELSPQVLHHEGLIAGLEWLARQMNRQFGLAVHLVAAAAPPIENTTVNVLVFRSVQELLFNTVKHAGVKESQIDISFPNGRVMVIVTDSGRGFDPDILKPFTPDSGFGLLRLQERARFMGGSLAVESAPGQGSKFILTVPLEITPPE